MVTKLFNKIFKSNKEVSNEMKMSFKEAIRDNDLKKVKYFLNRGVDPSVNDNFAIIKASEKGYLEIVELLLKDYRVDPTLHKNRAIRWASENGHIEVVKCLLKDQRVDPTDYRNYSIVSANYSIVSASDFNHIDIVKLLISDKRVRNSLLKEDIIGLIEIEYKLFKLKKWKETS